MSTKNHKPSYGNNTATNSNIVQNVTSTNGDIIVQNTAKGDNTVQKCTLTTEDKEAMMDAFETFIKAAKSKKEFKEEENNENCQL